MIIWGISGRESVVRAAVLGLTLRRNAEMAVRKMLKNAANNLGTTFSVRSSISYRLIADKPCKAVDYMDDGSAIALSITIDPTSGSATFDFEGTSPEARGNWNAPISVVHSAIIYWCVLSFWVC
jgi:5-oxoprolinase (ATP-hydrolysing)